jgi:tripartite-type tricarboxylate transporter receptor subunit TctC
VTSVPYPTEQGWELRSSPDLWAAVWSAALGIKMKNSTITFALTTWLLGTVHSMANAQQYPTKAIRWVVPSAPGDGSDITARLIGERVSRELGFPIVIDNKPGAGGVLGSEAVATAAPDGYTLIVGNAGSHSINAAIYTKLRYKVVEDFSPVALFCTAPNVMVVSTSVKAKTVTEFVALAKSASGGLNYASGGIGSSAHMSSELFKNLAGIQLTHIPYKGTSPAVAGIFGDEVQIMIGNLPPWLPHIKAGKVQALAVTSAKRSELLPDVPTMSEYYPGFETVAWFGLLAPKGTPKSVIDRMNDVVNKVLMQQDVKKQLSASACDPAPASPDEFKARIAREVGRWKLLSAEKNIVAD